MIKGVRSGFILFRLATLRQVRQARSAGGCGGRCQWRFILVGGAVVFISFAEAIERFRIVPYDASSHFQCHCGLPCIILTHALTSPALKKSHPHGMGVMQALPPKAAKEASHVIHVLSAL